MPQLRQVAERPRDADALAGGVQLDAQSPGQPVRARASALDAPAAPRVELADQVQQPRVGDFEVSRQVGDLLAEPLELVELGIRVRCVKLSEQRLFASLHGRPPMLLRRM